MAWSLPIGTATVRYIIATGEFTFPGDEPVTVIGYAGRGMWRNAPDATDERNLGPLPAGAYAVGRGRRHPRLGSMSIPLQPVSGVEMFGRSGFFVHGDNPRHDASQGCIILPRWARDLLDRKAAAEENRKLRLFLVVVAGSLQDKVLLP